VPAFWAPITKRFGNARHGAVQRSRRVGSPRDRETRRESVGFVVLVDAIELTQSCYLSCVLSWFNNQLRRFKRQRGGSPQTRFVILFPGRTGSSHLISCLARHPQIHVEGEGLVRLDTAAQREFLHRLYSKPAPRGVTAVGFKTKLKDVSALDEFASTLINHEVRILTLLRENRVKLAISTLNARRIHAMHGRWNLTTGQAPLPPLDACVDDIVAMIERVDAAQHEVSKFATSLPLPRLEVTYEALLTSHASSMTQIQEFLQVVPRSLMGDVAKATVDDLRRSVVHFDELAARLQHTKFAHDVAEG